MEPKLRKAELSSPSHTSEYIAPPVNLLPFLLGESEEQSEEEKELDARESNERSRISRDHERMVEDYNRQVALARQAVEERRTRAIESFLGSRGWIKRVNTVETSFYESGQRGVREKLQRW